MVHAVPRHRLRAYVLLGIAALLAAVGAYVWRTLSTPWVLDPPLPVMVSDIPDTTAENLPSVIEAPVTYDLQTGVDSLEASVPRTYGDLSQGLPLPNHPRMTFAYLLKRRPFEVVVRGQTVYISTVIEYSGRVWYHPPIGPDLGGSCGLGREARPRVRVTLTSTGHLTGQWQLRTNTRLLRLEPYSEAPRDRCRLTLLKIDVTDRVIASTRIMLEQYLPRFDDAVTRWPVRPRFERLWSKLQQPIRLADSVYLMIQPVTAQLGTLSSSGNTVVAPLRLIATPRIVTGQRPLMHDRLRALPALETARSQGSGAHIRIEASITYPGATEMMRRALVGRSLEQSGHHIRIRDVTLYGLGGGRMALAITVTGAVRGILYFVGTPAFDTTQRQIWVPDLDYDAGTANLMVQGLGWLQGVDIRDFLRAKARLPEAEAMGRLSELAQRGINRTLTPGVELNGSVLNAQATSASATRQVIRLRASADAQIELAIRKSPTIPRPPN